MKIKCGSCGKIFSDVNVIYKNSKIFGPWQSHYAAPQVSLVCDNCNHIIHTSKEEALHLVYEYELKNQ
jgi:hypothetical protein